MTDRALQALCQSEDLLRVLSSLDAEEKLLLQDNLKKIARLHVINRPRNSPQASDEASKEFKEAVKNVTQAKWAAGVPLLTEQSQSSEHVAVRLLRWLDVSDQTMWRVLSVAARAFVELHMHSLQKGSHATGEAVRTSLFATLTVEDQGRLKRVCRCGRWYMALLEHKDTEPGILAMLGKTTW